MKSVRVLLADDHPILLESLAALLSKSEGIVIVGRATNGLDAFKLLDFTPTDVVITDLNMPKLDGIDFAIRLREHYPKIKVILLTMVEDAHQIRSAIQAGVSGYVLKSATPDELRHALKEVAEGRRYFGREVEEALAVIPNPAAAYGNETVDSIAQLTKREIEIIRLIAQDCSSGYISHQLQITPHTLETHRRNIFKKIGVNSVIGLVRFAFKHKLLEE
ncbi:MAG: response regulator [Runella sp.]